jgi:gluconate 2-dehydrogenase gamma chain
MSTKGTSRRTFLLDSVTGLSGAWVAANYAGIMAAEDYVLEAAQAGRPMKLEFFTPAQATEVEAMAAQIIPTDETPGAREARVINFIDRALSTFAKNSQGAYTKGIDELQAQTKQMFPTATMFSALTGPQQIQVLTAMEKTPFFNMVRTHTVIGFFASPVHGGNQDKIGWKLIGYDDSLNFRPPFGYYDAQPQPDLRRR